jgi:hypothetical protein
MPDISLLQAILSTDVLQWKLNDQQGRVTQYHIGTVPRYHLNRDPPQLLRKMGATRGVHGAWSTVVLNFDSKELVVEILVFVC